MQLNGHWEYLIINFLKQVEIFGSAEEWDWQMEGECPRPAAVKASQARECQWTDGLLSKTLGNHSKCLIYSLFCTNTPEEMRPTFRPVCNFPQAAATAHCRGGMWDEPCRGWAGSLAPSWGWHGHCALLIIQWYPAWAAGSGCLVGHIYEKAKQADFVEAAEFVSQHFLFQNTFWITVSLEFSAA